MPELYTVMSPASSVCRANWTDLDAKVNGCDRCPIARECQAPVIWRDDAARNRHRNRQMEAARKVLEAK